MTKKTISYIDFNHIYDIVARVLFVVSKTGTEKEILLGYRLCDGTQFSSWIAQCHCFLDIQLESDYGKIEAKYGFLGALGVHFSPQLHELSLHER